MIGDVFLIPLLDDRKCAGQVIETEAILMNSITCAFFEPILTETNFSSLSSLTRSEHALACQFVTRDLFNKGIWRRIGNCLVEIEEGQLPHRDAKANNWVGAKVYGSSSINGLLNAYHGLGDWYEMKDRDYYQKLLLPGRRGPKSSLPLSQLTKPS